MQRGSTNQSAEILSRSSDFVPTAFDGIVSDLEANQVDWRTAMKRAVRRRDELLRAVGLDGALDDIDVADPSFPVFAPWEFIRLMEPGNPDDPLLRQVLPLADENVPTPGFTPDPVGDLDAVAAGGILHKYRGRALMLTTGACGIHCRYCFRREFPYAQHGGQRDRWRPAIEYVRRHPNLGEVLLSGGDPLTIIDQQLHELVTQLESVDHLRRLRIHTRMPIVIPQRVTEELVDRLARSRLAVWVVVHANHPRELSDEVLSRLSMLIDRGIPVLNQAVLLRGINDNAEALIGLCNTLVDHRIQPYYLHQLDRVNGAAHFEVPVDEGLRLMKVLRQRLPGYAVPTYVCEEPGEPSKTSIQPSSPC